jgi:hypothetical protein
MTSSLTIVLQADTAEDLAYLIGKTRELVPALATANTVAVQEVDDRPAVGFELVRSDVAPAPPPPANDQAPAEPVHAAHDNAVVDMSPEQQVQEGVARMMSLCAADPSLMSEVNRLRDKYQVKQLSQIPKDRAAEFFADTHLISAGAKEAA